MRLDCARACDVLVLGSGIAGVTAAMEAAAAGRSVLLACKGRLFSGSSFYPGTWGLGLIGPTDKNDERDLADTIEMVGCGMADPAMVRAFAAGIHPAIEQVRAMGVTAGRRNTSPASTISTGTGTASSSTAPERFSPGGWRSWA